MREINRISAQTEAGNRSMFDLLLFQMCYFMYHSKETVTHIYVFNVTVNNKLCVSVLDKLRKPNLVTIS